MKIAILIGLIVVSMLLYGCDTNPYQSCKLDCLDITYLREYNITGAWILTERDLLNKGISGKIIADNLEYCQNKCIKQKDR